MISGGYKMYEQGSKFNEQGLKFAQNALPPLESGKYLIEVSQKTNIKECIIEDNHLEFYVKTDSISMNPEEVYSVYPPKNSSGDFGNCLPSIVFHRRTFPWERDFNKYGQTKCEGMPWIALLVISEDENVALTTVKFSESRLKDRRTLIPDLQYDREDSDLDYDQMCQTVTIPYSLFLDILPYSDDLPYLAHAKQVSLDNKVTDSEVKGEWFSCLIANRYPRYYSLAGEPADAGIKHTVYLVSLEGFEEYIYYNAEQRKEIQNMTRYENVSMYCLYSWSFKVTSINGFNFYNLAQNIKPGTLQASDNVGEVSDESVNKLLKLGYVPINHYFREGSNSISWYHSPFIPQNSQWNYKVKTSFLSDELLEYDPQNGMFDISYSAAWQLGKLLALEDKDFSRKLLAWRLSKKSKAIRNQTSQILANKLSELNTSTSEGNNNENSVESIAEMCKNTWNDGVKKMLDTCGKTNNCNKTVILKNDISNSEPLTQAKILSVLDDDIKE